MIEELETQKESSAGTRDMYIFLNFEEGNSSQLHSWMSLPCCRLHAA